MSDKDYRVCKVIVMGKTIYEAWAPGPSLARPWLGTFADAASAKQTCEDRE